MATSISPVQDLGIRDIEVAINVIDREAAADWYAKIMGIRFDHNGRAEVGGRVLVLWAFPDARPSSHVVCQVVTSDLQRAHSALKAQGVAVSEIDRDCWNFDFMDPWGNKWGFYTPRVWLERDQAPIPD